MTLPPTCTPRSLYRGRFVNTEVSDSAKITQPKTRSEGIQPFRPGPRRPETLGEYRIMTTLEQRVARLEGGYEHLATKADLSKMESSLNKMESSLIKWMVGLMVSAVVAASAVAVVAQNIIG